MARGIGALRTAKGLRFAADPGAQSLGSALDAGEAARSLLLKAAVCRCSSQGNSMGVRARYRQIHQSSSIPSSGAESAAKPRCPPG